MLSETDPDWCRCLVLRCVDCGWEGNQAGAELHGSLNRDHLVGGVAAPGCGEIPCASLPRFTLPPDFLTEQDADTFAERFHQSVDPGAA